MKNLKLLVPVCLAALLSSPAYAAVEDGIAAVVNNEIITKSELMEASEPFLEKVPKTLKQEERERNIREMRKAVLVRMIDQTLVAQEARKSGIIVKDEEIMAQINTVLARKKMTLENLKEALRKEGTSFESYKDEVRNQIMRMRLASREIRSKITVSDDEIGEYYGKHRQDYEGKEAVRVRQIIIRLPQNADSAVKKKLRADAQSIFEKLKAGESFEALGAQVTRDSESAESDLGFVEKGALLPEMDEVAFKLKVGEFSGVIETAVGFHIIKITDRRGAGMKPLESVREEIKNEIIDEKMNRKIPEWIQELREKSYIDIRI
ncbi:MAG: peptidyl-prolyl cis-trans isomerase [Syntrophales bacterium]